MKKWKKRVKKLVKKCKSWLKKIKKFIGVNEKVRREIFFCNNNKILEGQNFSYSTHPKFN